MAIRAIDIETTGSDASSDAVIEIASVDVLRDGTISNKMAVLVNPGRPIPPESSAVHHLVDEDVKDALPFRDVVEIFAGANAYIAHNSEFEQGFLKEHLGKAQWICTYKCALRVWPDFLSHSNQALRYRLGLLNPFGIPRTDINPHRALSDTIVTAAIFVELMKHASWAQMVEWSSQPALLTRFGFGKHRGAKFADVPEDYLRWIIDKSDLDAGVKFSARHELDRRRAKAPA